MVELIISHLLTRQHLIGDDCREMIQAVLPLKCKGRLLQWVSV